MARWYASQLGFTRIWHTFFLGGFCCKGLRDFQRSSACHCLCALTKVTSTSSTSFSRVRMISNPLRVVKSSFWCLDATWHFWCSKANENLWVNSILCALTRSKVSPTLFTSFLGVRMFSNPVRAEKLSIWCLITWPGDFSWIPTFRTKI